MTCDLHVHITLEKDCITLHGYPVWFILLQTRVNFSSVGRKAFLFSWGQRGLTQPPLLRTEWSWIKEHLCTLNKVKITIHFFWFLFLIELNLINVLCKETERAWKQPDHRKAWVPFRVSLAPASSSVCPGQSDTFLFLTLVFCSRRARTRRSSKDLKSVVFFFLRN